MFSIELKSGGTMYGSYLSVIRSSRCLRHSVCIEVNGKVLISGSIAKSEIDIPGTIASSRCMRDTKFMFCKRA